MQDIQSYIIMTAHIIIGGQRFKRQTVPTKDIARHKVTPEGVIIANSKGAARQIL